MSGRVSIFLTRVLSGLVIAAMVAVCAPAPQGVVVSPRINVDGEPDYTNLGHFVAFYKDRGCPDRILPSRCGSASAASAPVSITSMRSSTVRIQITPSATAVTHSGI